jgi:RNA polymerase-interacting CarD/CdnL/TRCF family regulator
MKHNSKYKQGEKVYFAQKPAVVEDINTDECLGTTFIYYTLRMSNGKLYTGIPERWVKKTEAEFYSNTEADLVCSVEQVKKDMSSFQERCEAALLKARCMHKSKHRDTFNKIVNKVKSLFKKRTEK